MKRYNPKTHKEYAEDLAKVRANKKPRGVDPKMEIKVQGPKGSKLKGVHVKSKFDTPSKLFQDTEVEFTKKKDAITKGLEKFSPGITSKKNPLPWQGKITEAI